MKLIGRALGENDIYKLLEYYKREKDNKNNYNNPFNIGNLFDDLVLRDGFFNYSLYAYGCFNGDEISNIIIFQLPSAAFIQKSAAINYFAFDKSESEEFLKESTKAFFLDNDEINKVKLFLDSSNEALHSLASKVGFKKELVLMNEQGKDKHIHSYAYFK